MDAKSCSDRYRDFLDENITLEQLQEAGCYSSGDFEVGSIRNPTNSVELCRVIRQKKDYYNKTYDPSTVLDALKTLNEKGQEFYGKEFRNLFDLEKRENCCNCIAITLYAKIEQLIAGTSRLPLDAYLTAIRRSVKNVEKMLPDWLVRLYIDSSVFDYVQRKGNAVSRELLDSIVDSPNVEIHTIICNSSLKQENLDKTRVNRFLPLFDKTVNIAVIREADGIVTNLDCHNIRVFEESNKLFYLAQISAEVDYDNEIQIWNAYSLWIQYYKFMLNRDYFIRKHDALTLLAGTLAVKLRVKEGVFRYRMREVSSMIELQKFLTPEQIRDEYKANERLSGITGMQYNSRKRTLSSTEQLMQTLRIGFDEIFLLHLFRDLVCVDIEGGIVLDDNGFTNKVGNVWVEDLDPMYEQFFKTMFITPKLNSMPIKNKVITTTEDLNRIQLGLPNFFELLDEFLSDVTDKVERQFIIDAAMVDVEEPEVVPVNMNLLNEVYYKYSDIIDSVYDIFHKLK